MSTRYRTGWISDVHLGTRGCNAPALLNFLRDYEFETLYIVGDLIDIWSLRRSRYWPQTHNDIIQKILRKGRKGTRLVYIPGNHDEFLRRFTGDYGSLTIQRRAIHTTADGRRLLVIHGDELDTVVQNIKWLAFVGDVGYQTLLALNAPLNVVRRWCGLGYWSLSAHVKKRVKNAVAFIGEFEQAVARYAQDYQVQGVLCGHIHSPALRQIGATWYYNSGDFVESCSALVEHEDGRIELLTHLPVETSVSSPSDEESEPADDVFPVPLTG
ncbi:MAG: UDP-2,3-diacylglucosamine diphosphatase [Verrucomicrobia bacterium]|nr:UDP-2,3-diacylglucosamine diphosphatase [Verrucomicrobiota bacterium]